MNQTLSALDPLTRRNFVERCAKSAFGLSILPLGLGRTAFAAETSPPVAIRGPGFGKAKHVIFLQMNGGMTHIDTLDPKTGESKGPGDAIGTKGNFQISSFLPKMAQVADKMCVIRSMTAKVGVHLAAQYLMRTGFEQRGTIVHPALGAWAQHYLGASHSTLPSFVCINKNAEHGNGFFPSSFSPLPILDPDSGLQNAKAPSGNAMLEKRLSLVNKLDRGFRERYPDENVKAYTDFYDNTVRLMKSPDLKAFQLSGEPAEMREKYGKNRFGQGCLLARRLVESGVRFVEVTSGGWDMHQDLEDSMEERGGELDQAFSALIADLESRGLLASTLVVLSTEFGRKPDFEGAGRGHYPKAFSTALAGGGVKGGYVHGATDSLGAEPIEKPMTVGEFHATIGFAAGLPLEQEVKAANGRPFTVGDKGKPALEVFA